MRIFVRNRRFEKEHRKKYKVRFQKVSELIKGLDLKMDSSRNKTNPIHILIFVTDGLRKNNLSVYGYNRETTPNIDKFSNKSRVYHNLFSAAPWSYPSIPSMFTGLYPTKHGAHHKELLRNFNTQTFPPPIKEEILTIAEILNSVGFKTYTGTDNIISNLPLKGRFQFTDVHFSNQIAENINRNYLRWLDRNKEFNTFSYLHVNDLHEPIVIPKNFRSSFGKIGNINNIDRWDWDGGLNYDNPEFEEYKSEKLKLYDSSIKYVDHSLIPIFDFFSKIDNKLIFITADHGEEFWEHGPMEKEHFYDPRDIYGVAHGHSLFNEVIQVPMIIQGLRLDNKIDTNLRSHCDIFPTIIEHLNITMNNLDLDGKSMYEDISNRIVLSEACSFGFEKKAVIDGHYKLIASEGDKKYLLFDLENDEYEQKILKDRNIINRLKRHILRTDDDTGATAVLDERIKDELKKLGYLKD